MKKITLEQIKIILEKIKNSRIKEIVDFIYWESEVIDREIERLRKLKEDQKKEFRLFLVKSTNDLIIPEMQQYLIKWTESFEGFQEVFDDVLEKRDNIIEDDLLDHDVSKKRGNIINDLRDDDEKMFHKHLDTINKMYDKHLEMINKIQNKLNKLHLRSHELWLEKKNLLRINEK
jgi:hypothetical protein